MPAGYVKTWRAPGLHGFAAALVLTFWPAAVFADDSWLSRTEFRALVESSAAIETKDGKLQKWDFIFKPEMKSNFSDNLRLTALGRLRIDPVDKLEPGQPENQDAFRSPATRRIFVGDSTDLELRELYLDSRVGAASLRLGKQQIVWGQADGLRVLDIVNPMDFREFILPDFVDRRIPLWTVNAEVPISGWQAQFIWIPDHSYDETPDADATFAFTSPLVVPRPGPAQVGTGPVVLQKPKRPDRFVRDDDYGIRLAAFIQGWDVSINYLFHYQDQPVLFQRRIAGGGLVIEPEYKRTHLAGGTVSNAFGSITLRGEAGYSTDRYFLTRDPNDSDGVIKSGEFSYVLGLDYQYNAGLLISGQFFQGILTDHPAGTVRDRLENQATLRIQKKFLNDTLTASLLVIQSLNNGDGLVQTGLDYAWRSNITLKLGADVFYGDRDGIFGQFAKANRVSFGIVMGI